MTIAEELRLLAMIGEELIESSPRNKSNIILEWEIILKVFIENK